MPPSLVATPHAHDFCQWCLIDPFRAVGRQEVVEAAVGARGVEETDEWGDDGEDVIDEVRDRMWFIACRAVGV